MDCHGGDDLFASFHFDEIAMEVEKSVHVQKIGENFTCSKCHDPHTYQLAIRDSLKTTKEVVQSSNAMCLSCHTDEKQYRSLTNVEQPKLVQTHDWLPNQNLHFKSVRCIECHTSAHDTMNIAHNILPKTEAINTCTECHSTNSLLSNKLYKYKRTQQGNSGFYNDVIINDAYVIGANRNKYLNNASLLIFALTLGGIFTHIVFRIIKRK
jgi:hypothetical protein